MFDRRKFLRFLGIGSVGAAATISGMDAKAAETTDKNFCFTCNCGDEVIAKVPANLEDTLTLNCPCGRIYRLTWKGNAFVVSNGQTDDVSFKGEREVTTEGWPKMESKN